MNETAKNPTEPKPATEGQGFEILGEHDRVEYRLMDEQHATPAVIDALRGELQDWRKDHPNPKDPGKPYPLKDLAERISGGNRRSISHSTLSEWLSNKYKGNNAAVAAMVDTFLADERQRAGRFDFRQTAKIAFVHKGFGTINAAVVHGMNAGIVGPPGCGKTCLLIAYSRERSGCVYLRLKDEPADKRRISAQLCHVIQELRPMKVKAHPARLDAIQSWLSKRRNTVLLVDEAQKADRSGLELFRDLHDESDPGGHHRLPIIFAGDERFRDRLIETRSGQAAAIAPQFSRRMILLFDVRKQGIVPDGDEGEVFTVEDILQIVRQDRVKLLTPAAARWLARLANTPEAGMLGGAIEVLKLACDLAAKKGIKQVDVGDLKMAFEMSNGPALSEVIDTATGGPVFAKVG
jgi:hypothetical protein